MINVVSNVNKIIISVITFRWHLKCINLLEIAEQKDPGKLAYVLMRLGVEKHPRATTDVYIDTLLFTYNPPEGYEGTVAEHIQNK